jgi:SAM-dependent methyltransferase
MSLAYEISAYNRRRKWRLFLEEIAPTERMRILDVGFSEDEYSSTDNFVEKHYPYPEMLTAMGIDVPVGFRNRYPKVTAVRYDGGVFPFEDKAFDVCWSNAVIEHVGDRNEQILFLKEIKRISRRGYITTPNKYFPIETHTRIPVLHYLPKKVFDKFLALIRKGWAAGDYMHLLSLSDLESLLASADILNYNIFKNSFAGFTLDFAVIFE